MARSKLKGRDFLRALAQGLQTYAQVKMSGEALEKKQSRENVLAGREDVKWADYMAKRKAEQDAAQQAAETQRQTTAMLGEMSPGFVGPRRTEQMYTQPNIQRQQAYSILGLPVPQDVQKGAEYEGYESLGLDRNAILAKMGLLQEQKTNPRPTEWATKFNILKKYADTPPKDAIEQAEYDWAKGKGVDLFGEDMSSIVSLFKLMYPFGAMQLDEDVSIEQAFQDIAKRLKEMRESLNYEVEYGKKK